MNETRIAALLEEASNHYNDGAYDQATDLWRQVLAIDPGNQKAHEGIRMASLLGDQWSEPARSATADAGGPDDRVSAGLARIRELLDAGQIEDAREGCAVLFTLAPDLPALHELAAQVEMAAGGGDVFVGEEIAEASDADLAASLDQARTALAKGRNAEAVLAANRALQLDPGNIEACGILSRAADDGTITGPMAAVGQEADDVISLEDEPIPLEDPVQEAPAPTAAAAKAAPASAPATETGRLEAMIRRGQAEFDDGRLQDAIETWSRVFAVDSGNSQAGALIDKAKARLDEQGRRVDELFYKGVDALEAGQLEQALEQFRTVLSISPLHHEARERIEEIEARQAGGGDSIGVNQSAFEEVAAEKRRPAPRVESHDLFKEAESVPLAIPQPGPRPVRPRAASPAADPFAGEVPMNRIARNHPSGGGRKRLFAAAAGIVLVAGAGVGAWLYLGSESGSMPEAHANPPAPVASKAPRPAPPESESAAAAAPGQTLQVLPGAAAAKPAAPPPPPPPPPAMTPEQIEAVEREGRQYYQQGRWAESVLTLRRALDLSPADFDSRDELDKAMTELEKLAKFERESEQSTRLFASGDYGEALHKFYRLQQDHPELKQLDRWITSAWYNWGVTLLQSGMTDEAAEKFNEVLTIAPSDREAAKARDVAKHYHGRKVDSSLTSFAASLSLRTLEGR